MCTNKRAQANQQEIEKNGGFLVPPAMRLLCMCSMLVPSELSHLLGGSAQKVHCWERVRGKSALLHFLPGICCISESAKKLQKLFGRALSHLIVRHCLDMGLGDWSGGPQDVENGLPVVHIIGTHLAPSYDLIVSHQTELDDTPDEKSLRFLCVPLVETRCPLHSDRAVPLVLARSPKSCMSKCREVHCDLRFGIAILPIAG